MIDVSIIFVNYNTCKLTCDAIDSVYEFTKNLNIEIIVSDNDSKDNSISTIKIPIKKQRLSKIRRILALVKQIIKE